jgi:pilus assembly protein CpaE
MDQDLIAVLIDDDRERRALMARLLTSAGIRTESEVSHGIQAIRPITTFQPSFIFVSFEEPLSRAIQTVESVSLAAPDAVIVGYADDASTFAYQRAIRAGAKYLIDTPTSEREMQAVVESIRPRTAAGGRAAGSIVTVAGPKGGIGKTTISVNIASSLAHENKGSVLLIDLDPDFGDAGILLDLNTNYSTARAARDQGDFEFESFKRALSLHESGAYLLGAPQRFHERLGTTPEDLKSLVAFASQAFDYVILDTPCTLDDLVITAFNSADVTLLTTTLEFASLRNAALLLENMVYEGTPRERVVVVANHTDSLSAFSPGDAAEVLERQSVWEIPFDPAMPKSTQVGRPLTLSQPKSLASMSLRALASRLGEHPDRIDRRITVRGESVAPQEVRERLFSIVRATRPVAEPAFIFSAAKRANTYHVNGCPVEARLATRLEAPLADLPGHLKPCRVCLPEPTAAAA